MKDNFQLTDTHRKMLSIMVSTQQDEVGQLARAFFH
jgi:hypothetical protein